MRKNIPRLPGRYGGFRPVGLDVFHCIPTNNTTVKLTFKTPGYYPDQGVTELGSNPDLVSLNPNLPAEVECKQSEGCGLQMAV